jgi:hypothetical protein
VLLEPNPLVSPSSWPHKHEKAAGSVVATGHRCINGNRVRREPQEYLGAEGPHQPFVAVPSTLACDRCVDEYLVPMGRTGVDVQLGGYARLAQALSVFNVFVSEAIGTAD